MTTRKIPRSLVQGFDLDAAVSAYVAELKAWGEHNARCLAETRERAAADPPPTTPPENQFYPAPVPDGLVAMAIDVTHNANGTVSIDPTFTIEEDGPTPAEVAAARRAELHTQIWELEQAAGEAVMPSAKRRHVEYVAADAEAVLEANRTPAQNAAIKARDDMKLGLEVVARHGAKLQADVADLDDADIEGWKPQEFPR